MILINDLAVELSKNYTIEKEIGKGGMGIVYLATDNRLDRKVAIKVLEIHKTNETTDIDEAILRFQREAKSIARLSHNNIVTIHDVGIAGSQYYMVMEYIDGKSLGKILEDEKKLPINILMNIIVQICNCLDYVHENGVIHRDIKPDNIILTKKGIPKLTDFGIAQLSQEQKKLTQTGSFLGSIMYISPEQLNDSSTVDNRSDIYSLGITFYELLTGILPFDADTLSEILLKVMKDEAKPVSSYSKDIPIELDSIITKSLEKDVNKRYRSAGEMGRDIAKLLNNTDILNLTFNGNDLFSENHITNNSSNRFTKNTHLKKTTLNNNLIKQLRGSYKWIEKIIENWNTEKIKLSLDDAIKKMTEVSLYGKSFSGCLLINEHFYTFLYDGYFIGAVDISTNTVGKEVFNLISKEKINSLTLKIPEDEYIFSNILISSILKPDNERIHTNLDSSATDIMLIIDNMLVEEKFTGYMSFYTEKNVFYAGFYKGKETFFISINDKDILEYKSIKELVNAQSFIFNAYDIKTEIIGPSINNILKNTEILLKYKDEKKSKLYDIIALENKELPIHIVKEVKHNTFLDFNIKNANKIIFNEQEIDFVNIIKETEYYKFCEWLTQEYFYLLNSSGNYNALKYIYSWIPAIEKFKFLEKLEGDDSKEYEFSVICHGEVKGENYKKVLLLVRFGNGSKEDIEAFLNDSIQVKKKLIKSGDIGGAIYISLEEYTSDTLKLFYEKTVEPRKGFGLASLDKLTKYKGFVRIGLGRGFHLNLIEMNKNNNFDVIAPLLK